MKENRGTIQEPLQAIQQEIHQLKQKQSEMIKVQKLRDDEIEMQITQKNALKESLEDEYRKSLQVKWTKAREKLQG